MGNTMYGQPIDPDRPPRVERGAEWYAPIQAADLTDSEKAANARQSYLAAERAAFQR